MSNELKDEYLYVNFEGGVWEIRIGNGKDEKKRKGIWPDSKIKWFYVGGKDDLKEGLRRDNVDILTTF